ncbi:MAG: Stk1 family PASTA domain-containing Ser/Thr kinase [Clostridia bacterium]|nr:Stk1 family PASTA domain-containing Ser/Thr kinase [Clostridia bacterium]
MNLEGRLIGNRYEIIEKIGNGGMATVYKAKCHVLNRMVAVKILRDEFTTDEEFIRRFEAEAQSAASLTHPNIVSVYDVGNEGDLHYIVMELIKGKTLKEIIVEEGILSWKWSLNIAIQIASALEAAHKNGIIHRDIKPHNIIITEDGIAKVTDFGIAKAVSNSTITAFGTTIGSVHYFSPEHARGGFTDAKSDIYSLGIVMYEMLTGKVPFDADTPVSVALKHMQEEAVEPIKLNPALPISVNKIVIKAMQKDINLRYSSATEMLKDLSMAIKNPDGNFVTMNTMENNFQTQKIPSIYDKSIQEKIVEKDKELKRGEKAKKENKLKKFIKKHKALSLCLGAILLFALTIGITYLILTLINMAKPKDVLLPELTNLTIEEAKLKAGELNLEFEVAGEEYSPSVEVGKIMSQDPVYKPNYKVKEKSKITVLVSKGPEMTIVPKVIGMPKDEAIKALEDAKLKVLEPIGEKNLKVEEGYITKQSVDSNTETVVGTEIQIYFSIGDGLEEILMPNLVGKTEEAAKQELTNNKLKLNTVVYEEDKTKPDGTVLKQDKEAGSTIKQETAVTLTVNKHQQIKKGTVQINLKALAPYEEKKDENGEIIEPEKVKVRIVVDNDTVHEEKYNPELTNIEKQVEGIGTVTVKVYIGENNLLVGTKNLDLNQDNATVRFE